MKKYTFILVLLLAHTPLRSFCQIDSLKIFFEGFATGSREHYKIYFQGKLKLKIGFPGENHKYKIYIPKETRDTVIRNLDIFRKGRFSLKYRRVHLIVDIDQNKKYLIFWRDYRMKNRYALSYKWADVAPLNMDR